MTTAVDLLLIVCLLIVSKAQYTAGVCSPYINRGSGWFSLFQMTGSKTCLSSVVTCTYLGFNRSAAERRDISQCHAWRRANHKITDIISTLAQSFTMSTQCIKLFFQHNLFSHRSKVVSDRTVKVCFAACCIGITGFFYCFRNKPVSSQK